MAESLVVLSPPMLPPFNTAPDVVVTPTLKLSHCYVITVFWYCHES